MPTETDDEAVAAATRLARDGAARVLATPAPRSAVSRDGGEGARIPDGRPGGAAVTRRRRGMRSGGAGGIARREGGALDARGGEGRGGGRERRLRRGRGAVAPDARRGGGDAPGGSERAAGLGVRGGGEHG